MALMECAEPREEQDEPPPPPKFDKLGEPNLAIEFERLTNWTSHHSRLLL
jgi:hypothetical protein